MNEELIKRIGKALKHVVQLECDHNIALGSLGEVLRDFRDSAARKYVPMTDDELHCVWVESGNLNATETMRMVEAEVIRRAGLEVEK